MLSDLLTGALIGLIAVAIRFVYQKIKGPKGKKQKNIPAPAETKKEPELGSFWVKQPEQPQPAAVTVKEPKGPDPGLTIPEPVEAFYPQFAFQPPVPPAVSQPPVKTGGFVPAQDYNGTIQLGGVEQMPGGKYLGSPDDSKPFRLRAINGPLAGRTFPVTTARQMIGRNPNSNIVFPQQTNGVSGYHCVVRGDQVANHPVFCGMVVSIWDYNSTYGTYLSGGQRLQPNEAHQLKPGDAFFLGAPPPQGCGFVLEHY